MELSNIYLILYIFIWFVTFFYYQRRRSIIDGGSIVLSLYLVCSVLSYLLFNDEEACQSRFNELELFPFIYLYFMLMLATSPLLNFDSRKVSLILKPDDRVIYIVSSVFILFTLISFPEAVKHIQEGITMIMVDDAVNDVYSENQEVAGSVGHGGLSNITTVISGAFKFIGIFILFFLLTYEKKNKWIIGGLALSVLLSIFSAIASGSRGDAINVALVVFATYFLFRHFYSDTINKWCKYIGLLMAVLILIPIVTITLGRFGEDNSMSSVLYYAGQENLYFNNYGLDDNGIRYGDRTVPLFKRLIGLSDVPHNYVERREMYPDLKVNDEVFYTFVGDFTIDYGPILAVVIFVFCSVLFNSKTRIQENAIHFHQLLLLHFILCVCVLGSIWLFVFSDLGGNLQIIVYILVYLYSKYVEEIGLKSEQ